MAPTITNHPPQPPPSGIPDRASSADNSIRTRQPFKPDSKTTQCHKRGKVLTRMVRSLAWRVGLSAALFVLIIVFWTLGLIEPHGIIPR